jgi:peptide-methionine (R)-S-oxide reductase
MHPIILIILVLKAPPTTRPIMQLTRRSLFGTLALGGAAMATALLRMPAMAGGFEIEKTEEEWRKILSPEAFATLRQESTERPGTSPLLNEHRDGVFACAGCALPLYSSKAKYDSGTGWPSFFDALPNAIGTKEDNTLFSSRTEVHCRRCGGHLGHVFDDGPQPTGKRHCMNGVALQFIPGSTTGSAS